MALSPGMLLGDSRRARLLGPILYVLGLVAAYEIAQYILGDDFSGLAYASMAIAGIAIVMKVLNDWRKGVYLFLIWLLFEDLARKFLGNNMVIYFAKDCLLLIVIISFIRAYRNKTVQKFRPPFLLPLMVFIWFGLLQVLNPASSHIVYGLMGFKLFFYYVPLVFLGYALVNSETQVRHFFLINLALGVVIISLGTAQSVLGASFLNPEHPAEDIQALSNLYRVSQVTGEIAYRPTSVFVSAGRYANFILVTWLLVLGYTGFLLLRHKRGRLLALGVMILTAAGAILTASRGAFLLVFINALASAAAFIWGAPWRQREVLRIFRTIQRVALGIAVGSMLLFFIFPDALSSRLAIYRETLLPSSQNSELTYRAWDYPLQNFAKAFSYGHWLLGYGIGTSGLGSQYVTRFFHAAPPVGGVESGFGALVVEMGIGGLALWLVMASAILISSWKVVKALKGTSWFPLGFVIFWYAFLLLLPATYGGMQAYEDFLLNAYLWLLLGVLFRLPTLTTSVPPVEDRPTA